VVNLEVCGGARQTSEPLRSLLGFATERCWKWVAMVVLIVGPSSAAFAYWNGRGPGSASSSTGAMSVSTFTTPTGATPIDVPGTTGLFGLYLVDPAAQTENVMLTSGHWGTIGVEINHG
jgi:hypothetical protein